MIKFHSEEETTDEVQNPSLLCLHQTHDYTVQRVAVARRSLLNRENEKNYGSIAWASRESPRSNVVRAIVPCPPLRATVSRRRAG
jgi:hypothetical protein